jgi:hypothetical protein
MPTREFHIRTISRDGCAPHPAHIPQIGTGEPFRDVVTLVPRALLFVTLAAPNHLAVLACPGLVRAAPTLPGASRARLPAAAPPCCDRTAMKVSYLHSSRQRLTAGARVSRLRPDQIARPLRIPTGLSVLDALTRRPGLGRSATEGSDNHSGVSDTRLGQHQREPGSPPSRGPPGCGR